MTCSRSLKTWNGSLHPMAASPMVASLSMEGTKKPARNCIMQSQSFKALACLARQVNISAHAMLLSAEQNTLSSRVTGFCE